MKERDNENNKEINKFMAKVSLTNGYLKNMNQIIIQLEKIKSELNNAVSDKEKEFSSQTSFLITKFIEQQQLTKHIIDENTDFIKENEKSSFLLEQEKRIVSNLHGSLIKNFQETVNKFQILQNSVRHIKQSMTVREAEIWMGRDLNATEKENVLNDPTVLYMLIFRSFRKC